MEIDSEKLTISSALASMRNGDFSAEELTRLCLEQIERHNPQLNAIITLTPELALTQARQADLLLSRHPPNLDQLLLLGIPMLIKDLIDVAGVPTTAGSRFFGDTPAVEDADVVRRLKLAGATLLGKTNTHEYALGVTGVNPHFGAARNPHDPERIPGGSSSGSAVGVASGMCLAALGTDTGGSVRIPASLCGVVGLKPSRGRISTRGVVPLSWNLDHVGTLTRCVGDAAILLSVLSGYDPHDSASVEAALEDFPASLEKGVAGWRVALAAGEYVEACDPVIWQGVQAAALVLKDLGAQVEKVDLSWLRDLGKANGCMTQADAACYHRDRLAEHPDWFGEDVRQRLEAGAATSSNDYVLARKVQNEARQRFKQFFGKFDLLVLPTTPSTAPLIEGTDAVEAANRLTRFTSPFNLTGLPALSILAGSSGGLPFGVQLVTRYMGETRLMRAGAALEKGLGD
jgi:aspartyl-tRNA(Asn)/glutamyl-tRNA(Gln) amidotransferase subunit A